MSQLFPTYVPHICNVLYTVYCLNHTSLKQTEVMRGVGFGVLMGSIYKKNLLCLKNSPLCIKALIK